MAGLGDIRRATSGASKSLKDFQRALDAVKAIKIRETQRQGAIMSRRIGHRFKFERFGNVEGSIARIKPFSRAWARRKAKLRLDDRRGHARGGIQKQVSSPLIYAKLSDGFDIDIKRPALWITGRARLALKRKTVLISKTAKGYRHRLSRGRNESFFVNAYIDHFADQKAPGLGLLPNVDLAEMEQAVNAKTLDHLAAIRGAAKANLTNRALARLKLNVSRAA